MRSQLDHSQAKQADKRMTYLVVATIFSPSLRTRLFFSKPATTRSILQQYLLAPQSDDDSELPTERLHSPDLPDLHLQAGSTGSDRPQIYIRTKLHLLRWILRIASRPDKSGRSTSTWRSNRPGRNNAVSKDSGRLVAARTITVAPTAAKPSQLATG